MFAEQINITRHSFIVSDTNINSSIAMQLSLKLEFVFVLLE